MVETIKNRHKRETTLGRERERERERVLTTNCLHEHGSTFKAKICFNGKCGWAC